MGESPGFRRRRPKPALDTTAPQQRGQVGERAGPAEADLDVRSVDRDPDGAPSAGLVAILAFVDKHWSFAERSDTNAKRSLALLAGAATIGVLGVAATVALLVAVTLLVQEIGTALNVPRFALPGLAVSLLGLGAIRVGHRLRRPR